MLKHVPVFLAWGDDLFADAKVRSVVGRCGVKRGRKLPSDVFQHRLRVYLRLPSGTFFMHKGRRMCIGPCELVVPPSLSVKQQADQSEWA